MPCTTKIALERAGWGVVPSGKVSGTRRIFHIKFPVSNAKGRSSEPVALVTLAPFFGSSLLKIVEPWDMNTSHSLRNKSIGARQLHLNASSGLFSTQGGERGLRQL